MNSIRSFFIQDRPIFEAGAAGVAGAAGAVFRDTVRGTGSTFYIFNKMVQVLTLRTKNLLSFCILVLKLFKKRSVLI